MENRQQGFTQIQLMIVVWIIAIAIVALARADRPLLSAGSKCFYVSCNESAAAATLRNIASAQAKFQASGAIDTNNNGMGEYGYFAELSGGVGVRDSGGTASTNCLASPILSGAFANVSSQANITGGVVSRSGFIFQMYLPSSTGIGVPEADTGGVGTTTPDAAQSEVLWCCYAWPSSFGNTANKTFFVNQSGDVLMTKNLGQRYGGATKVPAYTAAFLKDAGNAMESTVAAGATGQDGQFWVVVR